MDQYETLSIIQKDIADLRKLLQNRSSDVLNEKWIPLDEAMSFFSYKPTQMAVFLKSEDLVVSKVGKRKFILRESIEKLLEKNIQNSNC